MGAWAPEYIYNCVWNIVRLKYLLRGSRAEGGRMGMRLVSVTLPEKYIEGLEELVRMGRYPNRSAAIRMAVRDLLLRELWGREREQ